MIIQGTKQRRRTREYKKTYSTGGLYMYISLYACVGALSQLARYFVGLVLEVSVPHGRLMPCGLA